MEKTKKRTEESRGAREIAYLGLSVSLLAIGAWISLPIGEVPFTLQTLVVCLIGGLFGWWRGLIAVAVYILMGLIGIPVFAGFRAGTAVLFSSTGGYIFGFLFAVVLSGLAEKIKVKGFLRWFVIYFGMIVGLAVCYFFGTVWFIYVYNGGNATPITVGGALIKCVVPFIVPDLCKLAVAALLTVRLKKYIK